MSAVHLLIVELEVVVRYVLGEGWNGSYTVWYNPRWGRHRRRRRPGGVS